MASASAITGPAYAGVVELDVVVLAAFAVTAPARSAIATLAARVVGFMRLLHVFPAVEITERLLLGSCWRTLIKRHVESWLG